MQRERLYAFSSLAAVFPGVGGFAIGILGRHAPEPALSGVEGQFHVEELQPQLLDAFAQLREDDRDQMIPLRVHVRKVEEMKTRMVS